MKKFILFYIFFATYFVKACSERKSSSSDKSMNTSVNGSGEAIPNPHDLDLQAKITCNSQSGERKWERLNQISAIVDYQNNKTSKSESFTARSGISEVTNSQSVIPLGIIPLRCDTGPINIKFKLYADSDTGMEFNPSVETTLDCGRIRTKINENLKVMKDVIYLLNIDCTPKAHLPEGLVVSSAEDVSVINKIDSSDIPISREH